MRGLQADKTIVVILALGNSTHIVSLSFLHMCHVSTYKGAIGAV